MNSKMNKSKIISQLSGEDSILDAVVEEIRIFKSKRLLSIELTLQVSRVTASYKGLKILFEDVKEYSFTYSQDYIFYNIESFKLINMGEFIYLSLDPADSKKEPSIDDLDIILAKDISIHMFGTSVPAQ